MKKKIDLEIAQLKMQKEPEDKLKISDKNQDTSFDIFYDIYYKDNESFFYIIMQENTANAPFYFIRSYTIEELHKIKKIFRVFQEDDFEEIKSYMKELFEKKKVCLSFELDREDIINMQLNVGLFAREDKVILQLYREMIPQEEKDQKLLDLYNLEKDKIKLLKQIKLIAETFNGNQQDKEIINYIKNILNSTEIPGIEDLKEGNNDEQQFVENNLLLEKKVKEEKKEKKEEIIEIKAKEEQPKIIGKDENQNKIEIEGDLENSDLIENKNTQIFTNLEKVYNFSKKIGNFNIVLSVKNIFNESWDAGTVNLVYNEEKSHIKCKDISNCEYDVGCGQDCDFLISFDEKDLKPGKKYKCCLSLYANGKKITEEDVVFKIRMSE